MTKIYPTNLRLAMDAKGITPIQLARQSQIPVKRIKQLMSDLEQRYSCLFEPDGHEVSEEELDVISSWLRYTPKFFSQTPIEIYPVRICVFD